MPKILYILLDAFRWDYLNDKDTPYIQRLSEKGVYIKKLTPSSGFAQRTTLFTGALPDVHGNYTMHIYQPNDSPFKILKPFSGILGGLSKKGFSHKVTRKIINQIPKLSTSWASPSAIPSEILHLISVSEDREPIYKPGGSPIESIFDKFQEHDIGYKYMMAPVSQDDEATTNDMINSLKKGNDDVYMIQLSDTDRIMHQVGTKRSVRKSTITEVDKRVNRLVQAFEQKYDNSWVVISGDHGMVDVSKYIDIFTLINDFCSSEKIKHRKDFLMFLDSVSVKFWFFNQRSKNVIIPFIQSELKDYGSLMNQKYMHEHSIPMNDRRYGDIIWRANTGVGIFPDYFHWPDDKYKAMHGYDCFHPSMKSLAIFYNKNLPNPKVIQEGSIDRIASTLCEILEIEAPQKSNKKTFLDEENK
jgi:predicted AlkP superfamily pyrophosphatase or phosphodiesterase